MSTPNNKLRLNVISYDKYLIQKTDSVIVSNMKTVKTSRISRYTLPIFIERSVSIHGDKFDYSLIRDEDVTNAYSRINLKCKKCSHVWECNIHNHISRKTGCPRCSGKLRWTVERFIITASQIHQGKYDYSYITPAHIKGVGGKVPVRCKSCNHVFTPTIDNHINCQTGCPLCAGNLNWTLDRFIATAQRLHANKYNYGKVKDIHIKTKKSIVPIVCNTCAGEWLSTIANHIHNYAGCPHCHMSTGEALIHNILKLWGISFQSQVSIPPNLIRKYDFYLSYNNISYILEYDGEQHFKYIPHFHGDSEDGLIKRKNIDIEKTQCALAAGYSFIRIDYTQKNNIEYHLRTALNSQQKLYCSTNTLYQHIISAID